MKAKKIIFTFIFIVSIIINLFQFILYKSALVVADYSKQKNLDYKIKIDSLSHKMIELNYYIDSLENHAAPPAR